ncbi:hypothetical protein SVTN_37580 [Streptomyces vietnamensis]|uniref:Uncharacterized protein n=1 Tax=Streptomyces vietnamensis TaxID=362257 RepID=A0A0B5IL83_9ACTN|nr:hypothetical protein SVTN_37580 [Streptomyces vietnamensis]
MFARPGTIRPGESKTSGAEPLPMSISSSSAPGEFHTAAQLQRACGDPAPRGDGWLAPQHFLDPRPGEALVMGGARPHPGLGGAGRWRWAVRAGSQTKLSVDAIGSFTSSISVCANPEKRSLSPVASSSARTVSRSPSAIRSITGTTAVTRGC